MKHIIIFLAVSILLIFVSAKAKSFELLMFHSKYCGYCIAFDNQVGFDYNTLDVAEMLPLTVIDFNDPPKWVIDAQLAGQIKPVSATPTFIIWDEKNNKEVDRLVGYRDREWFINAMKFWIANYKEFYDEDGNLRPDAPLMTEPAKSI